MNTEVNPSHLNSQTDSTEHLLQREDGPEELFINNAEIEGTGLTDLDLHNLKRKFGSGAPAKPRRSVIVEKIREAAPQLIELSSGAKLLAASTILVGLKSIGHKEFATHANFMGDCLGKAHSNLPRVTVGGKKRYALHMLDATDKEKAAFQAELDSLTPEQRKALMVA